MKKLNIFRLESGFSIMEVMIAAGLLGVVTIGVMKVTENMTKSTKTQAQQVEFNQIQTQVQSLLRDEYSCEATLLGVSPAGSGSAINQIKRKKSDGSQAVVFETGKSYGSSTSPIFLKSMAIKNFNASTGMGEFIIQMNKGRKDFASMTQDEKATVLATSYGTAVVTRSIKVNMVLDGAGKIEDCVSDKDDYTSGTCGMLDGDWSDKVKCKSINVQGNGTEPSITAETYLHVKRGLNVGSTLSGDPGDGNATFLKNIDVKDKATVANDTTITSGKLIFNDGDARINPVAGSNLYIENKSGTSGGNIIAGRSGSIRTTVTPTSVTVNKNGTIGAGLALEVIGNTTLTGSGSTSVTLRVGNADIQYNGSNLVLNRPGAGKVEYRDGSTIEEVASQGFVNAQLARALTGDSNTLNTLLSNLSTLIGSNPTMAISASVCGFYTNMTWIGGRCVDRRNTDCPANQMMIGFDNGSPQCVTYVKTNQRCPAGQLWTGINASGDKECSNADTQIGGWVDAKVAAAERRTNAVNTCKNMGASISSDYSYCSWNRGCSIPFDYDIGCWACPSTGSPSCAGTKYKRSGCGTWGSLCQVGCRGSRSGSQGCWCYLSGDGKSCGSTSCGTCQ